MMGGGWGCDGGVGLGWRGGAGMEAMASIADGY